MTTNDMHDQYEGHLDEVQSDRVCGWAWRSDFPNDPIFVDLYIDGQYETAVSANLHRPDLVIKGSGQHAFEFKLPDRCHDGNPHLIRLCYHKTDSDLYGSPQTICFERKAGTTHGLNSAGQRVHLDQHVRRPVREDAGNKPEVSVIIQCYNSGAYLDQTVQSVLDQTFDDFEIVIVDDGSTDPATRHLFTSYQRPKTRIIRTEHRGLAAARNLGIKEASGRYVSCLDADGLLEPTFLQRTIEALDGNHSLAFASCWLRAFGEVQYFWNPTNCALPRLLAENTVCTAALMRKEALIEIGGFDARMPVQGEEDWDLAISLVERGLNGMIIPEYLFRRRIRPQSVGKSSAEPANRALLMGYLVNKHMGSYKQHLAEVLDTIERRTLDLKQVQTSTSTTVELKQRVAFLEDSLHTMLHSRSWRSTQPLRRVFERLQRVHRFVAAGNHAKPRVSIIVECGHDGGDLRSTIESLDFLLKGDNQIILVHDGRGDLLTQEMLEWYRATGLEVLRLAGIGSIRSRLKGLAYARAPILFAMSAGERLEAAAFQKAVGILESDPNTAFVCGGLRDPNGFSWTAESAELAALMACPRMPFPLLRQDSLQRVGGYDGNFSELIQADWDLRLRLAAYGERGVVIQENLISARNASVVHDFVSNEGGLTRCVVRPVFQKHRTLFENYYAPTVVGHENLRTKLQLHFESQRSTEPGVSTSGSLDWGSLRRLEPVSAVWGLDRGQPIDRYYIDSFLQQQRADIRGRVLEVKDPNYTRAYGQQVQSSEVIDIAPNNPAATIVGDLRHSGVLSDETYDCFIFTQTLHFIYEMEQVVENAAKALRPNGVLLATLPCVSRVDYESGRQGDFWRFTPAAATKLFEDTFGIGNVEIQVFGNVLVCCGFLMGFSAGELTAEELNHCDPYFPLIVCVRAVKRRRPRLVTDANTHRNEKAVVLLYHRVDRVTRDRWNLCVSPENFEAHLQCLSRCLMPVRLSELAAAVQSGKVQHGMVAVTFDDGYRDNLTTALPLLKDHRIPATFFISGDGAIVGSSFWWEALDGSLEAMELDEESAVHLHHQLMNAAEDERHRILTALPSSANPAPARLNVSELRELAREPLVEIGAHGWSHTALAALPVEKQRQDVLENIRMIMTITGLEVRSFAYPFGGPFTSETKDVLRERGIEVACTVVSEPVTSRSELLAIPRLEVGNWDGEEFEARVTSVLSNR